MAKRRGYYPYRGRSPLRSFLKFLIGVLVVVLLLFILAFIFFQQYIVYSADGIRLELPFFQQSSASPAPTATPEPAEPTPPLVIETPAVVVPAWLHGVVLPNEALYDGTAPDQLEAAGGNAAVFNMKADNGSLSFISNHPLAISAKVSSGDAAINAAIRALNQGDLYTVARVSCFKDHNLSNADRSLAITTNSGYRWTDPDGVRWISPTSETVREYVTGVCVELAQLGFDEILLVNSGYPTQGNLHYIKKGSAYNKDEFAGVIEAFYAQVAQALSGYPVKLSILTDSETVKNGRNELSGQTLDALAQWADRVWLINPDSAALKALEAAGFSQENIVLVNSEADKTEQPAASSWAILPATLSS